MAKLVITLLLAFLALASAHTTTIFTTAIDDHNSDSDYQKCSRELEEQNLNQCRMYIMRGDQQVAQQCCQQLENVEEECQCEAVKQVFRDAVQQVQQQQGQQQQIRHPLSSPSQQIQRFQTRTQQLKNKCNLPRRCSIGSITTTTTTIDSNPSWLPFGSREEECSRSQIQRPVNQCRRYVEQQMFSTPRLLMSINRQQQQQPELRECCNELQNLNRECQCDAFAELASKVLGQQGGQFRDRKQQMEIARSVIQNLPNQCKLDMQQCFTPY